MFQCDAPQVLQLLQSDYNYFLNSDDLHDPELPIIKNRSYGGTMFLWRRELDPYIKVHKPSSPAFLAISLAVPGLRTSTHVTIYLATSGKEYEFVSELADLRNFLDELKDLYINPVIFIRGDGNTNKNNLPRVALLKQLLSDFALESVETNHTTYHHFTGGGQYDSKIDVILHTVQDNVSERVTNILCKHDHPNILSHHDVILSEFSIPTQYQPSTTQQLVVAPRVSHDRVKVQWTEEGQAEYQRVVGPLLAQARSEWLEPTSQDCMAVLLHLTNDVMNSAAKCTNKTFLLNSPYQQKKRSMPKPIKRAMNKLTRTYMKYRKSVNSNYSSDPLNALIRAKQEYRHTIRNYNQSEGLARDNKIVEIFANNPSKFFQYVKKQKKSKQPKIDQLSVGSKVYYGETVCDGFYDSMTALKICSNEELEMDPNLSDQLLNYHHILKLCMDKHSLPSISLQDSTGILTRLKKSVKDYHGITAMHYLNAGEEGLLHFNLLMNAIVSNVNNATIAELNQIHGLILYKGHRKDKNSHRAYRTISTCPLLAKSLDLYLRDLYQHLWEAKKAETQYQGTGSSHELASLLVTEAVQHSLHVSRKPAYLLALDAESAFDRCLRQVLCTELYKASMPGSAICFINNRLSSRATIYEWDGNMMGPAKDNTGFEQGGINSSDFYKLYNNTQLKQAQESEIGIDIESCVISAVGQADDVILAANDLYDLQLLVKLTENYCEKHRVKLEPSKTKLVVFAKKAQELNVQYAEHTSSITIRGKPVKLCNELEHVGVIRNASGNMPHIVDRIAKHKSALAAVLFTGAAKSHRGNPAASLRVHELYCTPVLLCGLATLVLSKAEIAVLDQHFTSTLQRLQRLHNRTPRAVVHLLAGCVPFKALLNMRQLSLFQMICYLPGNPLHQHAKHVLTFSAPGSHSWFLQVRDMCQEYNLPHPLELLSSPPQRSHLKKLIKLKVLEYWHKKLAIECSSPNLSSLKYLNPFKYSLTKPHPVWLCATGNSYEVNKSLVVARMISGRYRTEMLCRFWSSNTEGYCEANTCDRVPGDLEHLLVSCPALDDVREKLFNFWLKKSADIPALYNLLERVMATSSADMVRFILDPGSHPEVLVLVQQHGQSLLQHVLYLTRTLAYNLHKRKLILTGRWLRNNKQRINQNNLTTNKSANQSLFVGQEVHESPPECGVPDSRGGEATQVSSLCSKVSSYKDSSTTRGGVGMLPGCLQPELPAMTYDPVSTRLSRQQQFQHNTDKNTAQYSEVSVSVPAVGACAPGLLVHAGVAGADQGHGHAHEAHHHSPSQPCPSICSPSDDQNLSFPVLCLVQDGCLLP